MARGTPGALWKSEWKLTCRLTPSMEVVMDSVVKLSVYMKWAMMP